MNFELDEDQEFLRDGLRSLLEAAVPPSRVRESRVDGFDSEDPTWDVLAENGWIGLTVSEALGGAGLGFEEAMIVAMESGRALLHMPLSETIVATRALERHASDDRHRDLVADVVAGRLALTLALQGAPDESAMERSRVQAERRKSGWSLSGTAFAVSFGPLADACLVDATVPDEGRVLILLTNEMLGGRWSEREFMDRTVRRFDLVLDGLEAGFETTLKIFSAEAPEIEEMLDELRVLLAAENEGASRRLLEMTSRYVVEREQFGKPVGSNQAVKVRIAEMGAATERMRAAIYNAAMSIERGTTGRALAVAMAKHAAGSGGSFVGTQAIHLHGALGFTWEQDIHLYVKRIKMNELMLGGERECLARIADAVL